jgi:hypothetical protein
MILWVSQLYNLWYLPWWILDFYHHNVSPWGYAKILWIDRNYFFLNRHHFETVFRKTNLKIRKLSSMTVGWKNAGWTHDWFYRIDSGTELCNVSSSIPHLSHQLTSSGDRLNWGWLGPVLNSPHQWVGWSHRWHGPRLVNLAISLPHGGTPLHSVAIRLIRYFFSPRQLPGSLGFPKLG